MKLLKRLFPKWESKNDMRLRYEKELAFEKGANLMQFRSVERGVEQITATAEIDDMSSAPTEFIKRQLCRNLAENLMPIVEFDMQDNPVRRNKILVGKVYVSARRG